MALGKGSIWAAGTLAAVLAGTGSAGSALALQTAEQKQTVPDAPTPQQQQVPDAPTPQVLPQLKTITPAGPALPEHPQPQPQPDAAVKDNGGITPGSSLPAAPAPTPAAQTPDEGPPPELTDRSQIIHVSVNFVEIPFTVEDSKRKPIPALTWRDVRVYENGLRQHMSFFSADPFPLSVALVIDQSVTFDTMRKINDSLSALQGAFTPYDEVAVFTYNNGVTKQTTFTAAQSARLGVILDRSKGKGEDPIMGLGGPLAQTTIKNNQQVDPNTTPIRNQQGISITVPKEYHTLNDAVLAAAEETAKAPKDRRRVVYVVSDGKEYGSKASVKEVIRYLQTNNVSVYATLVGDSSLPGMGFLDRIHIPLTMRDDVLPRYTGATGGALDPEFTPSGIERSFAKLSELVRYQYMVGYYSHEPVMDGKFRKVEVRVMKPNLTVIAKDGYYPNARDSAPATATQVKTPTP
jgi:VWFA-related protein